MRIEEVLRRENMNRAYQGVKQNKGSAGVDGMSVNELMPYLQTHWHRIKTEILEGRYRPQPVLLVEIPKPGGRGMRRLGIPTVIDRLIQQAILQVLQPQIDPTFSDSSYGFRPGRSAHQADERARAHIKTGHRWVVDAATGAATIAATQSTNRNPFMTVISSASKNDAMHRRGV
jgi:RNA-directed DNA polymerase